MKQGTSLIVIITIFFCTITISAPAQTKARIFGSPGNIRIALEGEKIENGSLLSLSPGSYNVQLWAPHYEFLDTFIVITDKAESFRIKLSLSEEFINYKKQRVLYRKTKFKKLIAPELLAFGGTFGLYMYTRTAHYTPQRSILRKTRDQYNVYNFSLDYRDIVRAKDRIKTLEKDYKQKRTAHHILTSASVVGGVVASYFIVKQYKRKHKKEKPSYFEQPRLTFNSLGLSSGSFGELTLSLNININ
ncbi:MAG: hypothetical protein AB8B53_11420 [Flavobacteriales bacterium]